MPLDINPRRSTFSFSSFFHFLPISSSLYAKSYQSIVAHDLRLISYISELCPKLMENLRLWRSCPFIPLILSAYPSYYKTNNKIGTFSVPINLQRHLQPSFELLFRSAVAVNSLYWFDGLALARTCLQSSPNHGRQRVALVLRRE